MNADGRKSLAELRWAVESLEAEFDTLTRDLEAELALAYLEDNTERLAVLRHGFEQCIVRSIQLLRRLSAKNSPGRN